MRGEEGEGGKPRGRMTEDGDRRSPVKFAALLFFEKFNGASRDQRTEIRI